jgi:2-keto-4-pentenoate hydratase/2-oxohepta-3-ene-1,7-dioic acid hydratase in catechol pathway
MYIVHRVRVVTYSNSGASAVGLLQGDRVIDLAALEPGLPRSLRGLLEMEGGLERVRAISRAATSTAGTPINEVQFDPVIPDPHAIWCAALTFVSHATEAPGRSAPAYPLFFVRVAESQTGHRCPLLRPCVSDQLDYEGELAVVIGRPARHVRVEQALDYVAGYSCYNDGSVRDWQRHTREIAPGKNFASTGAFGPWLVTPDEFGDPYQHTITTRVNGEVRQRESIAALLFRIEYLIHYLSTIHTLRPGDVVVCGTPGGVGMRRQPPVFLHPGDVVSVEIDGIGTLENEVVAEVPAAASTFTVATAAGVS